LILGPVQNKTHRDSPLKDIELDLSNEKDLKNEKVIVDIQSLLLPPYY
jgi:hypothetical protein